MSHFDYQANKEWWVEREQGGYSEPYTFEDACEIAREDSIESSCVYFVRHSTGYLPRVIYHSGMKYEPEKIENMS